MSAIVRLRPSAPASLARALRAWAIACGLAALGCMPEEIVLEAEAADQVAATYCGELFACSCENASAFNSPEACRAATQSHLFAHQAEAAGRGLIYDQACVASRIAQIEAAECGRRGREEPACTDCFAYHGLEPLGAVCTRVGPFSSCEQGLECLFYEDDPKVTTGVCVPACPRPGRGDLCIVPAGDVGLRHLDCGAASVCDARTGRCVELPRAGSPCHDDTLCAPEAWCDPDPDPPLCAALKENVLGCDRDLECRSGWCREGRRCARPLWREQVCDPAVDRCSEGFVCDEDERRCLAIDAPICMAPPPSW